MKRCALYVRVSTQEQKKHGLSVDSQIQALKEYCEANGYMVQGIYNDAGISARKSYKKRPALLSMLEACQRREIDLVIFTRLDRFFRSVKDYYACIEQMNNVPWRTIWEDYETETSSGMFKVNIMLSIAQAEADRTSEKIKSVNEYRRSKGDYVGGKAPTGYRVEKSKLLVDESQRDGIEAFFKTYLSTFNLTKSVNELHKHGVMIRRDTACKMLHNPTYKGDAYGVPCESFITSEQFDIIQKSVSSNRAKISPPSHASYIFNGGILRCACCGSALSGSFRKMPSGKNTKYYAYYRCPRNRNMACENNKSITEMRLERELISRLESELAEYNYSIDVTEGKAIDYSSEITALNAKLERVGHRYEDGDISRDEYREKRDSIRSEIIKLEELSKLKKEKKTLPADWQSVYETLDNEHRKAFWYASLRKITFSKDAFINIEF